MLKAFIVIIAGIVFISTPILVFGDDYSDSITRVYQSVTEFIGQVTFKEQVIFEKPPIFSENTGGFATISAGSSSTDIIFATPYQNTPVVQIDIDGWGNDQIIQIINYRYVIANPNNMGFSIIINQPAETDLTFSWFAFAIKDVKTFTSNSNIPSL